MAVAPKAEVYARAASDRDEVAAFLRSDRRYAAYAFGDDPSAYRPLVPMSALASAHRDQGGR